MPKSNNARGTAIEQEVGDDLSVSMLYKVLLILLVFSFTSSKKNWKRKSWIFNAPVN